MVQVQSTVKYLEEARFGECHNTLIGLQSENVLFYMIRKRLAHDDITCTCHGDEAAVPLEAIQNTEHPSWQE